MGPQPPFSILVEYTQSVDIPETHTDTDTGDAITVTAPAKINLDLKILGRREDGLHVLDSTFHTISLWDELILSPRSTRMTMSCDVDALNNEDNLALRAARLMADDAGGATSGVHIQLNKQIPVGAGLGGGSSDAAATLLGLNRLWQLNWSRPRLMRLGAEVGSDVPFFLQGGAARVGGVGERIRPIPPATGMAAVILFPGVRVDTGRVFKEYARTVQPKLLTEEATMPIIPPAESVDHQVVGSGGQQANHDIQIGENHLEPVATVLFPQITKALSALREACGGTVRMSGSGSAVFCLADGEAAAEAVRAKLAMKPHWQSWVVSLTSSDFSPSVPVASSVGPNG